MLESRRYRPTPTALDYAAKLNFSILGISFYKWTDSRGIHHTRPSRCIQTTPSLCGIIPMYGIGSPPSFDELVTSAGLCPTCEQAKHNMTHSDVKGDFKLGDVVEVIKDSTSFLPIETSAIIVEVRRNNKVIIYNDIKYACDAKWFGYTLYFSPEIGLKNALGYQLNHSGK